MLALFGLPGGGEWVVIGLVALLIFGKRLPEVARSLGKGIVEFKKGLRGIEEEVQQGAEEPSKPARKEVAALPDEEGRGQKQTPAG